jgi:hypothetical protein
MQVAPLRERVTELEVADARHRERINTLEASELQAVAARKAAAENNLHVSKLMLLAAATSGDDVMVSSLLELTVGRCRLTVSHSSLKAPARSPLETII